MQIHTNKGILQRASNPTAFFCNVNYSKSEEQFFKSINLKLTSPAVADEFKESKLSEIRFLIDKKVHAISFIEFMLQSENIPGAYGPRHDL